MESPDQLQRSIAQALARVRARMDLAAEHAQRVPDQVRLLAVTKTQSANVVRAAFEAGQRAFGENYIQEGVDKIAALADLRDSMEWHCIGPVQSNKSRWVAEHFDWVQTVDRLKIAERLNAQRPAHLPALNVLIQVNVDGGATKSGVPSVELPALVKAFEHFDRLRLRGLMSLPELAPDFEANFAVHASLKALFDAQKELGLPAHAQWDTLSIGMSADLEAAIAAGGTMVRVGSALFGERKRPLGSN